MLKKTHTILLDLLIITIISSQLIKTQVYHTFGGVILSHEKETRLLKQRMGLSFGNSSGTQEGLLARFLETRLVSGEVSANTAHVSGATGKLSLSSVAALTPHR